MNATVARSLVFALAALAGCKSSEPAAPGTTTRTVSVTATGSGTGTITSSPSGINCGTTCSAAMSVAPLSFVAAPGATSQFVSWSGACSGTLTLCSIPAGTTAVSLSARFDLTVFTLTAALAGNGTGTVTSAPVGISCGSDCTEPFAVNTVVTLTAAPAVGSTFTGWSGGGCTGTGTCAVTVSAAATVTATFTLVTNTLTVSSAGNGIGTVTSAPAGITCGGDCAEPYTFGTVVTLTAAPAVGSTFSGWSGGGCTGTGTCVVTMNAAATVTATFTLVTSTLTVARSGTGTGTVTSAPAGINCGNDCTEPYTFGTVVTLTAASAVGTNFAGWSGAGCTGTGTCVVTMNAANAVTATFTLISSTLTVTLAGTGNGTVTSAPAGISCAADCSEPYVFGTVVTLTPAASDGSVFAGWTGACTGTAPCVVTMNAAAAVSATFNLIVPGWPDSGTRFCHNTVVEVTCPGGPVGQDGHYTINVPNYVVIGGRVQDPITGLVWQRTPPTTGIAHAAATLYCDNLSLDGADDWRLPNILELVSIADFGTTLPPFTASAFPGIPQNSFYWTSTDRADAPSQAFGINTNYPTTSSVTKSNATDRLVRCVRGAPLTGALSSTGAGILDNRTQLMWQSGTAPTDMNWTNALAYCEALVVGGQSDWRLPNGKELMSIVDPTLIGPSIASIFSSRPATRFWSSSVLKSGPDMGYVISFDTGLSADIGTPVTESRSVRCVR